MASGGRKLRWDEIKKEPMKEGITRKVIHGKNITLARIYVDAGRTVPEHSHHNEQISYVLEGRLTFNIEGKISEAAPGDIFVIPPGTMHKVTAREPSVVLDTFSPRRDDWMKTKDTA